MAARGTIGKQNVTNKIKEAFGSDYIGESGGKIYVWTVENGERIQIAIALTCPKAQVSIVETPVVGDYNFEDDVPTAAVPTQVAEITDEERERVKEMMRKLGL